MGKQDDKKYNIETVGIPLFSKLDKKDYDSFVSMLVFSIKDYLKEKNLKNKDNKPP